MTKIQERLHTHPHPSAPNISIIKSREPRLVVVKGLVINRKQQLTQGGSALKTRMQVYITILSYLANTRQSQGELRRPLQTTLRSSQVSPPRRCERGDRSFEQEAEVRDRTSGLDHQKGKITRIVGCPVTILTIL